VAEYAHTNRCAKLSAFWRTARVSVS